jgi:hypothetical protein
MPTLSMVISHPTRRPLCWILAMCQRLWSTPAALLLPPARPRHRRRIPLLASLPPASEGGAGRQVKVMASTKDAPSSTTGRIYLAQLLKVPAALGTMRIRPNPQNPSPRPHPRRSPSQLLPSPSQHQPNIPRWFGTIVPRLLAILPASLRTMRPTPVPSPSEVLTSLILDSAQLELFSQRDP